MAALPPAPANPSPLAFLPYGRQEITEGDIQAVAEVLRSDWLTQGPAVPRFEEALRSVVGAGQAVACANGTAALHLAMLALGLGPGDKVLTSPITFLASANCARYVGAEVCFADIDETTGLLDPAAVAGVLAADPEHRIKAILPVHFAGQPVDLPRLREMAHRHGAFLVDDACHAIGAAYLCEGDWVKVGTGLHTDFTAFSFHPVKHVTTGEGGALTTGNAKAARLAATFRTHGIQREDFQNPVLALDPTGKPNPWYYEQQMLGFNYRLTDIQAALGVSQLGRLEASIRKRNHLASTYTQRLAQAFPGGEVKPLAQRSGVLNAYHLFVVLIDFPSFGVDRAWVMDALRARNIGTQVHYIPVHLQPYYQAHGGTRAGDFPAAESFYRQALSLPMYPGLGDGDVMRVVDALKAALTGGA